MNDDPTGARTSNTMNRPQSPQRFFLNAPKQKDGECYVLNFDYMELDAYCVSLLRERDRMRAALEETLEELQLDDSRHDLMAKIISALSGEPGSGHETGKEPEAWLFHCWKPGSHAVYASVEKADNSWWPEHPNTPWKGVTRTALVKHGAPELIHGEPPPSERFAEKAGEKP